MSKKKKYVKSELTARERKEMRLKNEAEARGERVVTEEEYAVKRRRVRVFAVAAIIVAVILITAGIVIPAVMAANYMFERNPVAVFTFETGGERYELEYEIFVSDCPNMANNFMYLASIGFFDGVIVFDTQNSQVRFGGYTDPVRDAEDGEWSYSHRSDDLYFVSHLKDDFSPERFDDSGDPDVFKYQIRSDNTNLSYTNMPFALCGNISGSAMSATEFQFCCDMTADATHLSPAPGSSGSTRTLSLETFGAPLHEEEAEEIFADILALPLYASEDGTAEYARGYFRAPEQTVTLESVRMYNYDAFWLDSKYEYGFESYMSEELDAFSSSGTWSKNYI